MSYFQIGKNCLLSLAAAALTGCGSANQPTRMNPTWQQVVDDAVRGQDDYRPPSRWHWFGNN